MTATVARTRQPVGPCKGARCTCQSFVRVQPVAGWPTCSCGHAMATHTWIEAAA